MTDEYATKTMHEPCFSDLASAHNQICDHVSPTSTYDLNSKCMSLTIVHCDHTT